MRGLRTGDRERRLSAMSALRSLAWSLTAPTWQLIADCLYDADREVRSAALVFASARTLPAPSVAVLRDALRDDDPELRRMAQAALAELRLGDDPRGR